MPSPSPQLHTVQEWLRGYNEMNLDLVLSQCSESLEFNMLPVGHGQREPMSKAEYGAFLQITKKMVKTTTIRIVDTIESNDPPAITIHAIADGISSTDAAYPNEYIIMLWFAEENGSLKIIKIKELVDTLFLHHFLQEEQKRRNDAGLD